MIPIPRRILLYILLALTGCGVFLLPDQVICAQPISQTPDRIQRISIPSETVDIDSIPSDSDSILISPQPGSPAEDEGVDTTISYWADDIDFDVESGITTLTGHARIHYKGMMLSAAWIKVDWDNDLMTAGGTQDTIYTDSTETEIDTIFWVGQPIFANQTLTGTETMNGDHILYNYRTKKGRVLKGRTQYLDGYYWGDRIKRIEEETFFIQHGNFTTCDQEDDPHYQFRTRDMKMIYNDKVVAKPIVLYFSTVPVAIVPYGIFPNKRGRHSGILIPYYGETAASGMMTQHCHHRRIHNLRYVPRLCSDRVYYPN